MKNIIVAICLAFVLTGCASYKNVERAQDAGRIGCGILPIAGSICKEGIRKLAQSRRDDMYQILGQQAISAPAGELQPWSFKADQGFMVIHSRTQGELDDLGTFYVMDVSYFHVTQNGVENISEITLLAIPNPEANRIDQPAYIYLWR